MHNGLGAEHDRAGIEAEQDIRPKEGRGARAREGTRPDGRAGHSA